MDFYAVLGHPIAHSLSPQIHQAFAQTLGLSLSYEALDVAPEQFAATLQRLHATGYRGLNITLPHKQAAATLCESRSNAAERAGAVNTLIRTDAGWRGDNTDGTGLLRDLKDNLKLVITDQRVLLLGAGGAARGILKPLLDEPPKELVISSRTPWAVEKIAAEFKTLGPVRPCTHLALKGDTYDLIINATSAGHQGQVPRLPPGLLAPNGACYDLSYGRAFEPFGAWAQTQGAARIADGWGMLVEQAAASFELWHGVRPQTAAVLAQLQKKV
ncbi:MAG: shikimate dehydrogenase [Nevskiales bacterium]|nr:shikimate dehydrogenase [Nevskiales bacterium]